MEAKIGRLTLENDYLESALVKAVVCTDPNPFFWSSRKVSNGRLAEEEKSLDLLPDAQVERIKKCLGKPLLRNKLLLP